MRASENLSISPSVTFHRQPTKAGLEGRGDKEGKDGEEEVCVGEDESIMAKGSTENSVAQQ